ncbi:SDR family oxidoreductase [Streptomyces chattanoogensis]|uniref:SDR family oxidoreductase n=1 Tax=Streptomyces chattanoogensis TaxID=66876 RepID=UPI0036AB0FA8
MVRGDVLRAGQIGLARSVLRAVGSQGIAVNAGAAGLAETDMAATLRDEQRELVGQVPIARLVRSAQVTHAIRFLASSGLIGAADISVDGGTGMES